MSKKTPQQVQALNERRAEVMRCLIELGANVHVTDATGTPLLIKATPNLELMRVLIEHGVDVNTTEKQKQWTPLFVAAESGKVDALRYLVQHGALVTTRDRDGKTALDIASDAWKLGAERYLQRVQSCIALQSVLDARIGDLPAISEPIQRLIAAMDSPLLEYEMADEDSDSSSEHRMRITGWDNPNTPWLTFEDDDYLDCPSP